LKGGIVEIEETVAGSQLNKYVSAEKDLHATIEELLKVMFSV
jgi:hypothetical protein